MYLLIIISNHRSTEVSNWRDTKKQFGKEKMLTQHKQIAQLLTLLLEYKYYSGRLAAV